MVRRHHGRNLILVFFAGVIGAMIGTARVGPRSPAIHDEFSYLLAADTFSHGRLTNPTPPLYQHFETMHELMLPSYASRYPPGQGLALAVGEVLFGSPMVGVWLSIGGMAAAAYWMMLGWTRQGWALLGAVLVIVTDGVLSYWSQTYWGGAVAFAGGALVYGAVGRIVRGGTARVRDSVWLGIGLAILANSRPMEGLVVSLLPAAWLAVWLLKGDGRERRRRVVAGLLPAAGVLMIAGGWMGYYNYRITGSAVRLPFVEYAGQHMDAPLFFWQRPGMPKHENNEQMTDFARWEEEYYENELTWAGYLDTKMRQAISAVKIFPGVALLPAFLALPWVLRRRRGRAACLAVAIPLAVSVTAVWVQPHYLAPIAPMVFLLAVMGLREMCATRAGGAAAGALVVGSVAVLGWNLYRGDFTYRLDTMRERQAVLGSLQAMPGKQLVLVRYLPPHGSFLEWVFNDADMQASKVLWARELDERKGAELIKLFPDRQAWLVEVTDGQPAKLTKIRSGG